ncbi:MAG: DUF4476 domain-containing protein [Bacteroidota bacterium]
MRTIILIMALATLPTLTLAQHRAAVATFRSEGPFELRVFVNGEPLNRRPSRVVRSFPLRPGRHRVLVKAIGPRRVKTVRQTLVVRPGTRPSFAVRSAGRGGPLYVEKVYANRYPSRRDRFQEPIPRRGQAVCYGADYFPTRSVVNDMRARHREEAKLRIAKQAICDGSLYANDLRRLMRNLTFDESRIELAIYGHDSVCDVNSFHTVYDTFHHRQSVRRVKRQLGYI